MRLNCALILLFIVVSSCQKRIVELPETDSQLITEVNDISVAYIFYDEETEAAEFNRNNLIGTTNWLVNVDKRLTLGEALPHIKYLQQKRQKDGMHKNENARNYFSCSNPEIQNLAFIEFTEVRYHEEPIVDFLKNLSSEISDTARVYINVTSPEKIDIGKNFMITKTKGDAFIEDLEKTVSTDSIPDLVYLNFKNTLSVQDYITIKSQLLKIDQDLMTISPDEFIYK